MVMEVKGLSQHVRMVNVNITCVLPNLKYLYIYPNCDHTCMYPLQIIKTWHSEVKLNYAERTCKGKPTGMSTMQSVCFLHN